MTQLSFLMLFLGGFVHDAQFDHKTYLAMKKWWKGSLTLQELLQCNLLKIDNPISLRKKNAALFDLCKRKQEELGLVDIRIAWYHANKYVNGAPIYGNASYAFLHKNSQIMNILTQIVLNGNDSLSDFKIRLRHELAHIEQFVTGDESIGLKLGFHQGAKIIYKKMNSQRREQAADAAAFGECACWKCLESFAELRSPTIHPSATMNAEGYCVSPQGYLSAEEIMLYAEEAKRSGELCEEHCV